MEISVIASTKMGYFLPPTEALFMGGQFAGICYSEDGMSKILSEPLEKTEARINQTLTSLHHSVYGHPHYTLEFKSIPKILAMILNNEKCYNTSEKSARFTKMAASPQELEIYEKWLEILKKEISLQEPEMSTSDVKKKAQENARYMISVFTPATDLVYTASFVQLNYIMFWCENYIKEAESNDFNDQLIPVLEMFLEKMNAFEACVTSELIDSINGFEKFLDDVLNSYRGKISSEEFANIARNFDYIKIETASYKEDILKNSAKATVSLKVLGLNNGPKKVGLSLFDTRESRAEEWGENYSHTYQGTFTQLAQAQRHRTLAYCFKQLESPKFYIPRVVAQSAELSSMWLDDISSLVDYYPQGMLISINESGNYEKFIQKCTERLCEKAQLETSLQTMDTLDLYIRFTQHTNKDVYNHLIDYQYACRKCFGFPCNNPCKWGNNQLSRLF